MGNVCSGSGISKHVNVPRDPADKELDAIEMKETLITDFDGFFESASAPLNELVEIHNSIAQSEENLKSAAAAIQGETQVRLTVSFGPVVALEFWKFNENDEEHILGDPEVDEVLNMRPELRDAFDRAQHAIVNLNTAIEQSTSGNASEFEEKRGRLLLTKQGGQQDAFVRDVNVAVFTLRKEMMFAAHISGLTQAIQIFLGELAKVEDVGALTVENDDEDGSFRVMCGNQELDLSKMDNLSKPALQLRDAMVELLKNIQTAVTSVPELSEQSTAFAEEAQAFPSKVPDAIASSGLGITEAPRAAAATAANTKALSNGPRVAKATTMMIQYAARELQQAVQRPYGM